VEAGLTRLYLQEQRASSTAPFRARYGQSQLSGDGFILYLAAITVMVQGLDLEFLETANYSTSAGFPDMEARLDGSSVRPWRGRHVGLADLHFADGRDLPLDSRRALSSVMDKWKARGFKPVAGFELEFFLL
jgi:glutamine synthetase